MYVTKRNKTVIVLKFKYTMVKATFPRSLCFTVGKLSAGCAGTQLQSQHSGGKGRQICEFEGSLVHIERTARGYMDSVSKKPDDDDDNDSPTSLM